MFKEIFLFELRYRAVRPATYIYFVLLGLLAYFLVLGVGQFFDGGQVSVGGVDNKVLVNSPTFIAELMSGISFFGVLIISAIMGNPILRDFDHNTHTLLYSYPISKFGYLGGRFLGSLFVTIFVMCGIAIGYYLGTITPGVNEDKFGAFHLIYYVQPYLLFIIPNTILFGAIFFSLATLTRNILSTYVGSVIFLVLYGIASSYMSDMENQTLAGLLDPFGSLASDAETKYWSVSDKNNMLIPMSGLILWNRFIWLTVGLGLFLLTYNQFKFSQFLSNKLIRIRRVKDIVAPGISLFPEKITLPKVAAKFDFKAQFQKWRMLVIFETKQIISNVYFKAIVAAGLVILIVNATQIGKMYGTTTYPVTYQVIGVLSGSFKLFFYIIITFYAGEVIWRDRSKKIDELKDSLPIPSSVIFTSKLLALINVIFLLLTVIMISGIFIQTIMGYFNYEIVQYIASLYWFQFIDLVLLAVLVLFIQIMVNNKFIGFFAVVVYYLFDIFLMETIGLEHNLFDYGSDMGNPYSDMNGYGHYVWPFFVYKVYWASVACILASFSNMFWVRGTDSGFKSRLKLVSKKLKSHRSILSIAVLIFLTSGGFIYYNTNVLNDYKTYEERQDELEDYERTYRKFAGIAQPRITAVKMNVDIYPEERNFYFNGTYELINKHDVAIDSIHLNFRQSAIIKELSFNKAYTLVSEDSDYGYFIYKLDDPLLPGQTIQLKIDMGYETKGFRHSGSNINILHNGSFINSSYLPSIGYSEDAEISSEDERKKRGLPKKERVPKITDKEALKNNYISNDADWISFETTISTSADQYAIAPGYLQKEWTENNRRYFHYEMDSKILNFYAFQSAKYEVHQDQWKDVNIEIYYHKGHEYNVDKMVNSIKKSLDYYTKNFSPYQHKQVRIIEFPRYRSFAQSFPNTIPYSEAIGFIAKVDPDDPEDIDYPFYITAHEVAHQWWAHQVIGGRVQGMTVMSETMSQYSALMVMKKEFGEKKMKRFLKYEMDDYLSNRGSERKKELPLILNENQGYIHYEKGSVVMYALQDYIGEDTLNKALAAYIEATAFQEPPYTTSMEFLSYIKAATPDSLKYIIKDMFETITLYENKTTEVVYEELDTNRYAVQINIDAHKYRADSLGKEDEVKMSDWIDVAVMTREKTDEGWEDVELYSKKHKIFSGENIIKLEVNKKPTKAGIDPSYKLIDRHLDDNVKKATMGRVKLEKQ